MRRLRLAFLASFSLLMGGCVIGSTARATPGQTPAASPAPDVVATHWHEVASGLTEENGEPVAAASNRYLALMTSQNTITLLNTASNEQTPLTAPNCPTPTGAAFGGPWLALACSAASASASAPIPFVDLLNLRTGQWTPSPLDPTLCDQNGVGCTLETVGSTWIRFTTPPIGEHDPPSPYLQNIATGAAEYDPYSPQGVSDNLNNASGVSRPCAKLPTPALEEDFLGVPDRNGAYFVQLGRFVLTTTFNDGDNPPNFLQACGSNARTPIPQGFVATNDMVFWPQDVFAPDLGARVGLSLRSRRRLLVRTNKGPLVAASNRTLYETTVDRATRSLALWATTVATSSLAEKR